VCHFCKAHKGREGRKKKEGKKMEETYALGTPYSCPSSQNNLPK